MCNSPDARPTRRQLTRRDFLQVGAVATAAALVPATASAAPPGKKPGGSHPTPLQDPYDGSIPLVFPLADGTYRKPLKDNWHDNRDGDYGYAWSHENGSTQRAHDGIDIFPRFATPPATVYAPLSARVAAVLVDGQYRQNAAIAPPWGGYASAPEIYGNFLWLFSTDERSTGYFIFYCHLRAEPLLRGMLSKVGGSDAVEATTPVGLLGESGNAAGQPQLHMELHLPGANAFSCARCRPSPRQMTAANPFPSLSRGNGR